jgi:hypothetical protein
LSRSTFVCRIGAALTLILAGVSFALAQSDPKPAQDPMLANGPPVWDTNHDGVFTCDEWKKYADRIFSSADRNHDGSLDPKEFETLRKADATLADADFGYFDENRTARSRARSSSKSRARSSCGSTGTATAGSRWMK